MSDVSLWLHRKLHDSKCRKFFRCSPATRSREQVERKNTRTSFVGLADIHTYMMRTRDTLIDSSWRRQRRARRLVIPCSFSGVKLTLCDIRALQSPTTAVIVQLEFAKLSASRRLFRRELLEQARSWPQKGGRSTHNAFGNLSASCTSILLLRGHPCRSSGVRLRRINSETVAGAVAAFLQIQFAEI